jgi:hypothetical protein
MTERVIDKKEKMLKRRGKGEGKVVERENEKNQGKTDKNK